jgi:hypothetical protein
MSVDLLADPYAPELEWPYLRAAILARGGIGPSRDWDRDRYPADLYRAHGCAPDLLAAETCLEYADVPPWGLDASDSEMFTYLQRAYDAWQRAPSSERFSIAEMPRARVAREAGKARREMLKPAPAPVKLRPGLRSFAELVAELKRKHGPAVDLDGLRSEYVSAYETGERVTVERDGHTYRGTIGATRGPRPRFVLLLSLDL